MTGDDHATNGTAGQFSYFLRQSTPGCDVNAWECIRGTSYMFAATPIPPADAAGFAAQGFELGVHVTTGCSDYTPQSLEANFVNDLADFSSAFPGFPAPKTNRLHCVAWSDYSTQPKVELSHGIRLDTTYYYWPAAWVNDVPGVFTGSAMPMRFADADGTMIDVYQAATQMTDESEQTYPFHADTLLDRALGAEGYYGAYVANMHTDLADHPGAHAIVASAKARHVPVISARQLLDWVDGRNAATYTDLAWTDGTLTFNVTADVRANGLQMLLPAAQGNHVVTGVLRNGAPVAFSIQQLKGATYAVFSSAPGAYTVTYAADTTAPVITAVAVTPDATGATITWSTSEAATSRVIFGTNPNVLNGSAAVGGVRTSHSITLDNLTPGTTYYFRAVSADVLGNSNSSPAAPAAPLDFRTLLIPALGCPCSIWDAAAVPAVASASDVDPIELGVKFRPSANGYVTALRFYKGASNGGTHVGSLWTSAGVLLGRVTFANESGTGWQQATLPQPVPLSANATYVVSYNASAGAIFDGLAILRGRRGDERAAAGAGRRRQRRQRRVRRGWSGVPDAVERQFELLG